MIFGRSPFRIEPPKKTFHLRETLRQTILFLFLSLTLSGCGPLADHYNQKGAEAFGHKDLPEARRCFERAVLFHGSDPALRNNLGYVLYLQKEYDASEVQCLKALEEKPEAGLLRQVQVDLALLYCDPAVVGTKGARKDWMKKGIRIYEGLTHEDPQNAEYHLDLGFAYFRAANPGGGFEEMDKAVQCADPVIVARYTPDGKAGALNILEQVRAFYSKAQYFKAAAKIERKIQSLEKKKS